jgi:hypothetical protein
MLITAQKTSPRLAHGGILPDKIPQDQPCSRTEFWDFLKICGDDLRRQLFRILYYLTDRLGSFYFKMQRWKNNHPVEGISRFTAKGGLLP